MRERIRDYELMVVISPLQADENSVDATIRRLTDSIEAVGGVVTSTDSSAPWGRRKLAYPIRAYAGGGESSRRSFTEGFYVLLHVTMPATGVTALDRTIKYTDAILRHMLTVIELRSQLPSSSEDDADAMELDEPMDDEPMDDEPMDNGPMDNDDHEDVPDASLPADALVEEDAR